MNHLVLLIPAALLLGLLGLAAFLWSLKSGQYSDLDGAAWRAIEDDEQDEHVRDAEKAQQQSVAPASGSGRRSGTRS
ncbi:MAG: cbb3-type cytochrome oxidase assembly protein CcoS [Marivibrio sp.]|uniref:cbb3-type cytochrome oxidase assembly protein CcoS n=1 Tax=Marivibrio sp. TaxID=2039719 RepID=UPI0032EF590D